MKSPEKGNGNLEAQNKAVIANCCDLSIRVSDIGESRDEVGRRSDQLDEAGIVDP
jgi:hypothetical protein